MESAEWEDDSSARLRDALEQLDDRSRDIVQRRWMTEDKATLHELADKYGVSAERIRQIESSALGKLKGFMGPEAMAGLNARGRRLHRRRDPLVHCLVERARHQGIALRLLRRSSARRPSASRP